MLSTYTDHARARMQQRGIRAAAVEALLDYGRSAPAGDGCEVLFFDKAARKAARFPNTYAVVGRDGAVVTVGHRYRRVPRGKS
jgi:hypothetical protein